MINEVDRQRFQVLFEAEEQRLNSGSSRQQTRGLRPSQMSGDSHGGRFFDPSEAVRPIGRESARVAGRT